MLLHVVHDDGALGADRFQNLRVAVQVDAQVADGGVLVDGDDAPLGLPRRRQHERAMRQAERLADPTNEGLENLLGAQRGGDFLKDVEEQIARPQGVPRPAHLLAPPQLGVEARVQLLQVHWRAHDVVRAGGQQARGALRAPPVEQHQHRRADVAGDRHHLAHPLHQPRRSPDPAAGRPGWWPPR